MPKKGGLNLKPYPLNDTPFYLLYYKHNDARRDVISGTDGIIDRHEESRNALKILGCHQTIHLNFADTRAHLQLNDMISALED
ncbi:hypothetical protein AB0U78_34380, partial [Escherichia coli]